MTLPTLKLYNKELHYKDSVKFLGIIFDQRLTWKPHIDYLRQSCSRILDLMKTLGHHYWGSDTDMLLRIYKSLIRSKLDYGSISYSTASKSQLRRLDAIQSSALRTALGAFCTSPVESLHCLACEPPLHYRRIQLALSYATGVARDTSNPHYRFVFPQQLQNPSHNNHPHKSFPFHERLRQILNLDVNMSFPKFFTANTYYDIPPWTLQAPDIDTTLGIFCKQEVPPNFLRSRFLELCGKYEDANFMYTDASKSTEGVGAAVITSTENYLYSLPRHSSVFTGEIYALYQRR